MNFRLAIVFIASAALVLSGCRHSARPTSVTLVGTNGALGEAVFHLRCDPAGGDITDPARACAQLKAHRDVLLSPQPFVCRGGPQSWWEMRISGRFEGKPVHVRTSTCWTPQMELIDRLGIADQLRSHLVKDVFAVKRGMSEPEVRALAGTPYRFGRCWLYHASKPGTSIDGMRFCFTHARVWLIQTAVHG